MQQRTADGIRQGLVFKPVVEVVEDPMAVVDLALEAIERQERGGRRPCSWMQRMRGTRSVAMTPVGQAPTFMGRTCCFHTMHRYERQPNLPLPFEATCGTCGRKFRVKLDLVVPTARR